MVCSKSSLGQEWVPMTHGYSASNPKYGEKAGLERLVLLLTAPQPVSCQVLSCKT